MEYNNNKLSLVEKNLDGIEYYIRNIEGNPEREEELKEQQLFESKQYAERLARLKKSFDTQVFSDYFGKQLLQRMFVGNEGIKYKFKKGEMKDGVKVNIYNTELSDVFQKIVIDTQMAKEVIDTRDPEIYGLVRSMVKLYQKSLGQYLKSLGIVYTSPSGDSVNSSRAWHKMYEILSVFPELTCKECKTMKTFHMCEAPGGFILALEYFLQKKHKS